MIFGLRIDFASQVGTCSNKVEFVKKLSTLSVFKYLSKLIYTGPEHNLHAVVSVIKCLRITTATLPHAGTDGGVVAATTIEILSTTATRRRTDEILWQTRLARVSRTHLKNGRKLNQLYIVFQSCIEVENHKLYLLSQILHINHYN